MNKRQKEIRLTIIVLAVMYYGLAGILLNPLIVWTVLPLYFSWFQFEKVFKEQHFENVARYYGFLIASSGFSLLYHLAWFLDIGSMASGSSTSALIFIFFPIYAVVLGYVGYGVAAAWELIKKGRNST